MTSIPNSATTGNPVVEAAIKGDHLAFSRLVREHHSELRIVTFRMLGDAQAVDDVLQEAYIKAFRSIAKFRQSSSFKTWLYRIAYNCTIDAIRSRSKIQFVEFNEATTKQASTSSMEDSLATKSEVALALDALPVDQRAAILLVDGQGFDYASASEVLGVPVRTISYRLNRARAALKEALITKEESN